MKEESKYVASIFYRGWTVSFAYSGEEDVKGFLFKEREYDSLKSLLSDPDIRQFEWRRWKNNPPQPHDYILSDYDFDTLDDTKLAHYLIITRGRNQPLTDEDMKFIHDGLSMAKIFFYDKIANEYTSNNLADPRNRKVLVALVKKRVMERLMEIRHE